MTAAERPVIRSVLDKLVGQGLLIPASRLWSLLPPEREAPGLAAAAAAPVTTVAIPTCGRPIQLKRLLESLLADRSVIARRPRVLVVDDSRDDQARSANLEVVRALADGPLQLSYADREDRARFARELSRVSGVPEAVARYALLGDEAARNTVGATRNSILLATLGELIVSMDDDMHLGFFPLQDSEFSLTISGSDRRYSARRIGSLEEFGELSRDLQPLDFIGAFEGLLGRTLHDVLRSPGGEKARPTFDQVSPEILDCVQSDAARVTSAFMGAAGRPGIGGRDQFLFHSGQKLASITRSRSLFERSLLQPVMIAGPDRQFVSRAGVSMMGIAGLDNRLDLPPFLPVWVGEDDFFGKLHAVCDRYALRAYLPYSMLHHPDFAPESWDQFWEGTVSFNVNGLLIALLDRLASSSLVEVGAFLAEIADLGLPALEELMREIRVKHMRSRYARYEEHREKNMGNAPDFYHAALEELGKRIRRTLESSEISVPSEFRGDSVPASMRRLQALIRATSALLASWGALVDGAKALSSAGRTLFR
ncbi:MAG TPA: hypothetical protein VM598_11640 [Bdellovibrionota bacterium]|nr:hypothetical protein [Bdellovibrionota bacterium]